MISALILTGGSGSRLSNTTKKQYLTIGSKSILEHTLQRFQENKSIDRIILVVTDIEEAKSKIDINSYPKLDSLILGGSTRQESVKNGLELLNEGIVLIHDGARPFVSQTLIDKVIEGVKHFRACTPVVKSIDSLVETEGGLIKGYVNREKVARLQTPQGFLVSVIKEAHYRASIDGFEGSDDTILVDRIGVKVSILEGEETNFKITTPEDYQIAKLRGEEYASRDRL